MISSFSGPAGSFAMNTAFQWRHVTRPPFALVMQDLMRAPIRAISFDVTGTILAHRYPIFETYATAAKWAQLPNPPTAEDLKPAFKKAYYQACTERPCFGHALGQSPRAWWVDTVKQALVNCGRVNYTEAEFNRFFRRVYQHYGSLEGMIAHLIILCCVLLAHARPDAFHPPSFPNASALAQVRHAMHAPCMADAGYVELPDAKPFLDWAQQQGLLLGITTNTPARTMDTVVPMLGFHDYFKWYVSLCIVYVLLRVPVQDSGCVCVRQEFVFYFLSCGCAFHGVCAHAWCRRSLIALLAVALCSPVLASRHCVIFFT